MAQVPLNETTPNGGDLDANFTELYSKKAWSSVGIGYATGDGAGSTVTQLTSKSTAVTLNKMTGKITMNAASLASGESVAFALNNSLLTADDLLICHPNNGTANYTVNVLGVIAGAASILLTNRTGALLAEAVVLNFAIVKGAAN